MLPATAGMAGSMECLVDLDRSASLGEHLKQQASS